MMKGELERFSYRQLENVNVLKSRCPSFVMSEGE
jgi:hypothetical protein